MSTNDGNRILHLDLLRGIAVLGLLLMNLPGMGMPEIGYVRYTPDLIGDQIYAGFQALFFDGRFRSLFCLLFGVGLYLQYLSYQRKNLNSDLILKSRLNWLLVFGLIHCIFIWPGDILILYALSGMYLKSKLDWPAEKLIKRGIIFFIIGMLIMCIEIWITADFSNEVLTRQSQEYIEAIALIKGSYWEIVIMNAFLAFAYIVTFPILSLFYFAGIMLLAVGLYKSGKLTTGFNKRELWLLVVITVIVSAIDAYIAVFQPETHSMLVRFFGSISGLTMALLIWHIVISMKVADSVSLLSISLQNTGRIAFTLYILQSIVMAGLFRYLCPELNESYTLTDYALVSVGFIMLQMTMAYGYFIYFKQGPLEKLWRTLVNRKITAQTSAKQMAETNAQA